MSLALDAPLSEDEYTELDDFLCAGDEEEERLPVDEAHGFMTAMIVGHAPVEPEALLESVWGQPAFADEAERERMTDLLLRLFRDISMTLKAGRSFEPLVVEIEEDGATQVAHEGWCFGFMLAVSGDEERWSQLPKHEQSLLGPIARLALLHVEDEPEIDEEEYDLLVELLPGAVAGLNAYWESNWG
ncbi:MAG: YecA family protein [Gammaproteobacteria bacterium]